MSGFATKLAQLAAMTAEYRAAAIDLSAWLAANNRGPDAELDAIVTVETLATCMEMANGGASSLAHITDVILHNAANAHGRPAISSAVAHGRLLGRECCPCASCSDGRAAGVAAAQGIHAAALAAAPSTSGGAL